MVILLLASHFGDPTIESNNSRPNVDMVTESKHPHVERQARKLRRMDLPFAHSMGSIGSLAVPKFDGSVQCEPKR